MWACVRACRESLRLSLGPFRLGFGSEHPISQHASTPLLPFSVPYACARVLTYIACCLYDKSRLLLSPRPSCITRALQPPSISFPWVDSCPTYPSSLRSRITSSQVFFFITN